ncbi:MAG: RnfH family protein [Gammaproteobacteria bacterium]|nr:RnfH family protein [Gammaproteobacteria bacterium]
MSAEASRGGERRGGEKAVVEVVYALPDEQHIVEVGLTPGMTAGEAVRRSGLLEAYPEIERPLVLGLFGEPIGEERPLVAGDRVEITRPLTRDPRDLRRERVARGGAAGKKPAKR